MIVLVRTGHKNFCPHNFAVEHAIENESIDRSIAGYKSTKMASEIIDVLTRKDITEEVLADDPMLGLSQTVLAPLSRVENRSFAGKFIESKYTNI